MIDAEEIMNDVAHILPKSRRRGPSGFEVIDRTNGTSHGNYETLEEARGCVAFDKLTNYEIWQGDHIVAEAEELEPIDLGWYTGAKS